MIELKSLIFNLPNVRNKNKKPQPKLKLYFFIHYLLRIVICNFLSSSIGFNPRSCFHRLTLSLLSQLPLAFHSTVSCFLSTFFLRCFSLPFVRFSFGFRLLSLCFFRSLIFLSPSHSDFVSARIQLSYPTSSPLPFA